MSESDFNRLVDLYLDHSASAEEVARLREMLMVSPELTRRFKQQEKLHRAQVKCLSKLQPKDAHWLGRWLMNFAQRSNRTAAYVCLLMVVLVQTRVGLESDYRGLNLYVIDSLSHQDVMAVDEGDESERWFEPSASDFEATDIAQLDVMDEEEDV